MTMTIDEKREAYQARQDAKRERLQQRAEKAQAKADAAHDEMRRIGEHIPMGQPILVGHHSERRHRRDIARIDRRMGESVEQGKKAARLAERAENFGERGISAEDPDAVAKLRAKLENLEASRDAMKAANRVLAAAHRKAKKANGGADIVGVDAWAAIVDGLDVEPILRDGLRMNFRHCAPEFVSYHSVKFGYAITNIGGNIRTVKKRIEAIEAEEARRQEGPAEPMVREGFSVEECPDDDRIRFFFEGKPSPAVRKEMKSNGWRWSPRAGAWQRQLNANGRHSAAYTAGRVQRIMTDER